MKTLALTMIVKNEERCLKRCLDSVRQLVDKMIIVDTGSSDRTKEIAEDFGAAVYDYSWENDFSAARNYALSCSDCDWNLVLDADEYLTEGSRADIESFLEKEGVTGSIQCRNLYRDKDEISCGVSYLARLLPRGYGFSGRIHEQVDARLKRLSLPLVFEHDGYLQEGKEDRNYPLIVDALAAHPDDMYYQFQLAKILFNMKQWEQADEAFGRFYQKADREVHYWKNCMVSWIYNSMERKAFSQVLELIEAEGKYLEHFADYQFACGVFYMRLVLHDTKAYIGYLPLIEKSYLNCLSIGECAEDQGVYGTGSFKALYNLGTWYEVAGDRERAFSCYRQSAQMGYKTAEKRLKALGIF